MQTNQITKEEKGSLSALWLNYIFIPTCLIHPVDQVDIGHIACSNSLCPLHISLLESHSLTAFSTTKAQWTLLFMVTKFSIAVGPLRKPIWDAQSFHLEERITERSTKQAKIEIKIKWVEEAYYRTMSEITMSELKKYKMHLIT